MPDNEIIDEGLINYSLENSKNKYHKIPQFIFIGSSIILWITSAIDYLHWEKVGKYISQFPSEAQPDFGEMKWIPYYHKFAEWGAYLLILAIIFWILSLLLTFLIKESRLKLYILIFGVIGFLSPFYLLWIMADTYL
jgi:hypothetical protein